MGQLLIGCHGGEQHGLDDLIGGGGRGGGGDGDLAELAGEGRRAETAVRLQADASVLTEQRTEDCRGDNRPRISWSFTHNIHKELHSGTILWYFYFVTSDEKLKHVTHIQTLAGPSHPLLLGNRLVLRQLR